MKMRAIFVLGLVLILVILAVSIPAFAAPDLITFEDVTEGETVQLDVGTTRYFNVTIDSDATFVNALLLSDQYYPGRGIFMGGVDIATQDTYAELQVSATGKNSTAGLPAAEDCDEGQAPVGLVAAVRYPGGQVESQRIDFCIIVDSP